LKKQNRNRNRYKSMIQSTHLTFEIGSSSENLSKQILYQNLNYLSLHFSKLKAREVCSLRDTLATCRMARYHAGINLTRAKQKAT